MQRYGQTTQWIALMAITALALYMSWLILEPFTYVLVWAAVIVLVFQPLYNWLLKRLRRPNLCAMLSIAIVIFIVVIPIVVISALIGREVTVAVKSVRTGIEQLMNDPHWGDRIRSLLASVQKHVDIDSVLQKVSQTALDRTTRVLGGAFGFVINLCFMIFTMFFLFRDGHRIIAAVSQFMPLEPARTSQMLARARDIIGASINGVLVIALVQGTLGGIMFWILGVDAALVWGVVMTILSMIPLVGSLIVWIPAAIYLAVSGHWTKAIILVVWGGGVISSVDNFLRPKLVGSRAKMHELLVFFSVLGGLQVFGAVGILLGPVVMAITIALLDTLREPALQE